LKSAAALKMLNKVATLSLAAVVRTAPSLHIYTAASVKIIQIKYFMLART